ncbi:PWWP domain-containing protein 3-like [Rosa rugosa]|uniref:PWWP domain-containing protein 3-like n=1 Tax=Rosa rugosa TaxID=74645 RepID=UPI002B4131FC|nr:PWWP domain-containing protein 3-like [Rosa rugosa]
MVEEFRVGKMVEDVRVEKMMVEDGRVDRMVEYDGVKEKVDEAKAFESSMMGEDDQDYDYDFCVGDIVWVKTKINTWWPARIHDPADASKYGGIESDQEDCLLVGYFGMGHVAWCRRYQLKPFPSISSRFQGRARLEFSLKL